MNKFIIQTKTRIRTNSTSERKIKKGKMKEKKKRKIKKENKKEWKETKFEFEQIQILNKKGREK